MHVVDATGQVVAQHDGVPGTGQRPTSSWAAGEEVADRHGLLLPASGPGEYAVRAGLYDPDTGERLCLADGAAAVELCTLAVIE